MNNSILFTKFLELLRLESASAVRYNGMEKPKRARSSCKSLIVDTAWASEGCCSVEAIVSFSKE